MVGVRFLFSSCLEFNREDSYYHGYWVKFIDGYMVIIDNGLKVGIFVDI